MKRQTPSAYRPVRFDCTTCNTPWFTPDNGCPRCKEHGVSIPDPIVWQVGRIPETGIFLSAHLRDYERFMFLRDKLEIQVVVDVANDPDNKYVWRPTPEMFKLAGVEHVMIPNIADDNVGLSLNAFYQVDHALMRAALDRKKALLHCSAGLKRAPHLAYGVLRAHGYPPDEAWNKVEVARPFVSPFEPYIHSAEEWVDHLLSFQRAVEY